MTREDFFEKLDDFDFDSFGKDNCLDNSDCYQVVQFFANKIYDDFENRSCDGCEHIDENYKLEQWSTYTYNYCNKQEVIIDGVDDFCCNKFKPKDK